MRKKVFLLCTAVFLAVVMCLFSSLAEEAYALAREDVVQCLLEKVYAGETSAAICADEKIYDLLSTDKEVYDIFCEAKIAAAEWQFSDGVLTLEGIVAYPDSVYVCTLEEAAAAFSEKPDNIVIVMPEEFFEAFIANDFALYFRLDSMAGIKSKESAYFADTRTFVYENIEYCENFALIETFDGLVSHVASCAGQKAGNISYVLSEDMFDMLKGNIAMEQSLFARYGMYTYSNMTIEETRMRLIEDIEYYPGARIVDAVKHGRTDKLADEDKRLYEEALFIADEARRKYEGHPEREIMIERELVLMLSGRCTYFSGEEDANNTAVGAILLGYADCDGYADAFYLLGNLAGLCVEYQYGYVRYGGMHMWNAVRTEYGWHFTDVAGCDMDSPEYPNEIYTDWMGMGLETACERYIWQTASQREPIGSDNPARNALYLMGNVFSSVEEARAFLEKNTQPDVRLAVTPIPEENIAAATSELVYGYGGPYFVWSAGNTMYVSLVKTFFAYDNFYDCRTMDEIALALCAGQEEIFVRVSEELFAAYLADDGNLMAEAEKAAGIVSSSRSLYDTTRVFWYTDIVR